MLEYENQGDWTEEDGELYAHTSDGWWDEDNSWWHDAAEASWDDGWWSGWTEGNDEAELAATAAEEEGEDGDGQQQADLQQQMADAQLLAAEANRTLAQALPR